MGFKFSGNRLDITAIAGTRTVQLIAHLTRCSCSVYISI